MFALNGLNSFALYYFIYVYLTNCDSTHNKIYQGMKLQNNLYEIKKKKSMKTDKIK